MKNTKLKGIIATFLIGGFLLLASSEVTLAQSTGKTTTPTKTNTTQNFKGRNRNFDIKPVLDKLVKAKTITAAQETKIIAYEKKQSAARTAEMQKFSKMTAAQRQAYFAKQKPTQNQNRGQSQYTDLVKNKTITQKQADAISKAVAAARPKRSYNGFNGQNHQ